MERFIPNLIHKLTPKIIPAFPGNGEVKEHVRNFDQANAPIQDKAETDVFTIFMLAPAAICYLKGKNHTVTLANDAFLQLIEKGGNFVGKPLFESLPELKTQGLKELFDSVIQDGNPDGGHEQEVTLISSQKRQQGFYNFVYHPIQDQDHTVTGIVLVVNEVTEQEIIKNKNLENQHVREKELEEKVQQRTLELSAMNESLQQKNQEIALSKYNKRFLTEFSENFSAYKLPTEFFDSLVQFIADTTRLDYAFVGKLVRNDMGEFTIQTIAITAFGKLTENISYPLPDGPCEQVIRGMLYSFPKQCRQLFPRNKTIDTFKVEGYLGYPLYDEQGNAVGLIAVMHEKEIEDEETVSSILKIVARRAEIELERIKNGEQLVQNNKTLKEKNDELIKINKELESFSFVASHDLQEPLRKIQTFTGRILEKEFAVLSNSGKDYFQRIQNAAERMRQLIQDLLTFSHINTTERKFETTDLSLIVEEVKNELKETIQEKQVIIEANGMCEVNIIPFQFRQLLYNLIGNSLKFSKSEKPLRIIIKSSISKGNKLNNEQLSPDTEYCHISISDNGIGFDSQYKDQIFEVFQRLHGKDEFKGTGIGLAIVKKIVENHKGVITATGEIDKGATFDIYIPTGTK